MLDAEAGPHEGLPGGSDVAGGLMGVLAAGALAATVVLALGVPVFLFWSWRSRKA